MVQRYKEFFFIPNINIDLFGGIKNSMYICSGIVKLNNIKHLLLT